MSSPRILLFALLAHLALTTAGCGSIPHPQALPDGSLVLECEGELSQCVSRAESFCGDDPVEVLEAGSREGRHGDARYSDGSRISTVKFVCGNSHAAIDIRFRRRRHQPESPPPAAATATNAPPAATSAVCAPGATQACFGAGACQGGQTCLAEGEGWGPCDCGDQSSASKPEAPPAAEGDMPGAAPLD